MADLVVMFGDVVLVVIGSSVVGITGSLSVGASFSCVVAAMGINFHIMNTYKIVKSIQQDSQKYKESNADFETQKLVI